GGAVRTQDRVGLATLWELDVWGRVRRTVESNRESARASAGDLAAMLLSEQATLAQSYFQLRVTDLDLGLLERSMAAYEKALEVTRNRYQAGVAERWAAAANAQIGIARAAWFPTLSLGGSGGYASSSFSGLLQVPNRFWSLGPDLAGTLVDFGARRYQVRAAIASYDQSVATYRQ